MVSSTAAVVLSCVRRVGARMTETFDVDCPGCGDTSRAISVDTQNVGIHCSCGVTASVDVEAQAIDDWWERD
uniref:Uncharacterized protein n=2 Tax=Halorubrum lacusprofundi TaxID=2247 RepID=A0A220SWZ3_9EURY|nr:hypothetical protein [Halorubrum lacusprofundi]